MHDVGSFQTCFYTDYCFITRWSQSHLTLNLGWFLWLSQETESGPRALQSKDGLKSHAGSAN